MPYILYTLAPNRAKYLTPDPDPLLQAQCAAQVLTAISAGIGSACRL